jgi:hypothetical protein
MDGRKSADLGWTKLFANLPSTVARIRWSTQEVLHRRICGHHHWLWRAVDQHGVAEPVPAWILLLASATGMLRRSWFDA